MYPGQHKTIMSSAMCTLFFVQSKQCTPWVLRWPPGQISDLEFNMPRQNSYHRTLTPYSQIHTSGSTHTEVVIAKHPVTVLSMAAVHEH